MAINLYAAANRNRGIALTDFITAFDATVTDSADAANTDTVEEFAAVIKALVQAGTITNLAYDTTTMALTVTAAGGATSTIDLSGLASTGTPTIPDGSIVRDKLHADVQAELLRSASLNGTTLSLNTHGGSVTVDLAGLATAESITQFPTGIFWFKGQNERYPRGYPFTDNIDTSNRRKRMTFGSDTPDEDFGNFHSTVGNIWVPVASINANADAAQGNAVRQFYQLPTGRYDIEIIAGISARQIFGNVYLAVEQASAGSDDEQIVLSVPYAETTLTGNERGTAFAPIELHDWVSDGTAQLSTVLHTAQNALGADASLASLDNMKGYMRIKKVG